MEPTALSSPLSRLTRRLLDPSKHVDYLWAFALAAWPAVFAKLIGVADTLTVHRGHGLTVFPGYWDAPNWTSMMILLPLSLYLFRWGSGKLTPVADDWPPKRIPAIITLIDSEEGRESAYRDLRSAILAPALIGAALATDIGIHVLDMSEVVRIYFDALRGVTPEIPSNYLLNWMSMFMAGANVEGRPAPTAWVNLAAVLPAYVVQFSLILIAILFFYIAFRHNVFFLNRVYQRRRHSGDSHTHIIINLNDGDRCFGFRRANAAFNAQVACLSLCGAIMLISRYVHVQRPHTLAEITASELFLDPGQWMLGLGWLAALCVVSIPVIVKLLPRLHFGGPALPETTVVSYLREFLPDYAWPFGDEPTPEEMDYLASKFAENAFWPTGNDRANRLFFYSFLVFSILALPIVRPGFTLAFAGYLGAVALVALILTMVSLQTLRLSLSGIDARLSKVPATPIPIPESVSEARRRGKDSARCFSQLPARRHQGLCRPAARFAETSTARRRDAIHGHRHHPGRRRLSCRH